MSVDLRLELREPLRSPAPFERSMPRGVRFVDESERDALATAAAANRSIVLRPRADAFGALARAIDADFESALAVRGAMPAPVFQSARLVDSLEGQLRRARMLPALGICLALPRLARAADAELCLAADDARYLTAFMRAAWENGSATPILVLFSEADRRVALPVPRTLEMLVDDEIDRRFAEDEASFEVVESIQVFDGASEWPPASAPLDEDLGAMSLEPASAANGPMIPDLVAAKDGAIEAASNDEPAEAHAHVEPADARGSEDEEAAAAEAGAHPAGDAPEEEALEELIARSSEDENEDEVHHELEAETAATEHADPIDQPAFAAEPPPAAPIADTLRPPPSHHDVETAHAYEPDASAEDEEARRAEKLLLAASARAHAIELDAARGPKPVSAIERLFAQHYVPLVGAIHRGEADHTVKAVATEWSRSFAESYNEAFSNIRVTGKRPAMTFDAFDIASRIGRLSSARSVKVVLVDAMSFDLSERVAARMKTELDKRAVHVERTTLWSALPSRTPTQLQLLARGSEGLKEAGPVSSSEPDVTRGRSLTTMRRERLGSRELMKLDLVEARLHAPGAAYDERLDALADEVTDLIVMFMETLPPRTLLYVFGDHGFILGPGVNGWATGPAIQGGASPDEVLVAGNAWLVDAMQ